MSNSSETQSSKGITFSFTRKSKQQNLNQNKTNKFSDLETNDSLRTDFVTSIDDKQIQSTVKEVKKKELVIPLITTNRYRLKNDVNKQSKTQSLESNDNKNGINEEKRSNDSLEDMAKEELLNEAKKWKEEPNETRIQSSRIIPVIDYLIQNRVPEGFETDDKFDVSLRPVEPNLDDYESVPVQEFGLAMLRGMGWKPGLKE
jgi:G patch domain/KOW motif-containing protein